MTKRASKGPSRSGGDTPGSSPLIREGGHVDAGALRRAWETHRSLAAAAAESAEEGEVDPDKIASQETVDDDAPNRVVFVLQKNLGSRLDKYLASRIAFMSRAQLQRLIDEGGVSVNGKRPKSSTSLRTGDRVEVLVPPPPPTEVQPEQIELEVLHEDSAIIVINKRPGIIVHPARAHNSGTMINALAWHFQNRTSGGLSQVGKEFARPGVIHRLDRDTSGAIVFGKDDTSHWRLARQFAQRTVDKRYLALVHGQVSLPVDVIDLPLGPHPSREKGYREKYVVRHDHLGKASVTICRVRARFPLPAEQRKPGSVRGSDRAVGPKRGEVPGAGGWGDGFTLVELELRTGRTHQIRVHLSHQGHPIVGDDMYGGGGAGASPGLAGPDAPLMTRQALHAETLGFRHPVTEERLVFHAPLPPDLLGAIAAIRQACREKDVEVEVLTPPGATVELGTMLAPER